MRHPLFIFPPGAAIQQSLMNLQIVIAAKIHCMVHKGYEGLPLTTMFRGICVGVPSILLKAKAYPGLFRLGLLEIRFWITRTNTGSRQPDYRSKTKRKVTLFPADLPAKIGRTLHTPKRILSNHLRDTYVENQVFGRIALVLNLNVHTSASPFLNC